MRCWGKPARCRSRTWPRATSCTVQRCMAAALHDTTYAVGYFLPSAERYFLLSMYGFSAQSAEKPYTEDVKYHCQTRWRLNIRLRRRPCRQELVLARAVIVI